MGSRRNRRLQDILVHSSIPLPHKRGKQGKRINECPKTAGIYCDSMDKTGHIHSYTTKQSYESKFNICCQSSNLVYCLQCNTCGKQYVGQTKRKLLERLREHFNNIRKKHQSDPIGSHFNTTGHSGDIKQVITYILAFITPPGDTNGALQMRECALNLKDTGSLNCAHRSPMVSTPWINWKCLLFRLLPSITPLGRHSSVYPTPLQPPWDSSPNLFYSFFTSANHTASFAAPWL